IWPVRKDAEGTRFFANGGFFTPDRKARFIAPDFPAPRKTVSREYPFVLNTGRARDQWHTMTRTGLSPRLALHAAEPFVEIHPDDARALGVKDFARVITQYGSAIYKVALNEEQQRGALLAPIHWSGETASAARTCELVSPYTDAHSGQPEAKATPATIEPVEFAYRGFILSRQPLELPQQTWWARVALTGGIGYLIASQEGPKLWREHARDLLGSELAE